MTDPAYTAPTITDAQAKIIGEAIGSAVGRAIRLSIKEDFLDRESLHGDTIVTKWRSLPADLKHELSQALRSGINDAVSSVWNGEHEGESLAKRVHGLVDEIRTKR
ncbi:MAG: hypothetical protein KC457_07305 [Myxococcales bacterium]|nr:hypothetical protein [Myxococcales bacterium]